jgi:hypothetical protein
MTSTRSTRAIGPLAVAVAIFVAACSGSTSSGAPSAAATTAASTAPSAPAGTTAPSAAEGLPSLPIAIPSFDIGELTKGLANVDSYKVAITTGDQSLTGTVVTKPELARDYTMTNGTHIIVIGDKA